MSLYVGNWISLERILFIKFIFFSEFLLWEAHYAVEPVSFNLIHFVFSTDPK